MKRVFLVLFLLILFAWWFNLFPSYTNLTARKPKAQFKFKIIELFR